MYYSIFYKLVSYYCDVDVCLLPNWTVSEAVNVESGLVVKIFHSMAQSQQTIQLKWALTRSPRTLDFPLCV